MLAHGLLDFLRLLSIGFTLPKRLFVCRPQGLTGLQGLAPHHGVPLAPYKTEGPTTVIKFLGSLIDSAHMECRLLEDKVQNLRELVSRAKGV